MKPKNLLCLVLILLTTGVCERESARSSESVEKTTPLHQAAADGDIEQVRLLISKGAAISAHDEKKNIRTVAQKLAQRIHLSVDLRHRLN